MFQDPHMIYIVAKQKHEELLAELEKIQKIRSSSNIVLKENRRLGKIMLPIADMFIAMGIAMRRRWGGIPERIEDVVNDEYAR